MQSWTLAAMVALGELPHVHAAINADTHWEHRETYKFAETWSPWLHERGVNVVTVSDESSLKPVDDNLTHIPAFTKTPSGRGQLRRQCTSRWKIKPVKAYIAKTLSALGLPKKTGVVQLWLGITTDEWHRAKPSRVKYIEHTYPLLELNMSRRDCIGWLNAHQLPTPPKSSCVFCPYKDQAAWVRLKDNGGPDWKTAVDVDEQIRNCRPPYPLFLHPSLKPLQKIVTLADLGLEQRSLFDAECDSGFCFL